MLLCRHVEIHGNGRLALCYVASGMNGSGSTIVPSAPYMRGGVSTGVIQKLYGFPALGFRQAAAYE